MTSRASFDVIALALFQSVSVAVTQTNDAAPSISILTTVQQRTAVFNGERAYRCRYYANRLHASFTNLEINNLDRVHLFL